MATSLAACGGSGTSDLASDSTCVSYCERAADCWVEAGERDLGQHVTSPATAECAWSDRSAVIAACAQQCTEALAETPTACVVCRLDDLSASCFDRTAWTGCQDACPASSADPYTNARDALPQDELVCWSPATANGGPSACGPAAPDPVYVTTAVDWKQPPTTFTVTATVSSIDPVELTYSSSFAITLVGLPSTALQLGEVVEATVYAECPFWCNRSVVIRDPATQALRAAVWSSEERNVLTLPEVAIDFAPSSCASNAEMCGLVASFAMTAESGGVTAQIEAGATAVVGAYDVKNGRSGAPLLWACTDTPPTHIEGYIVAR